MGGVIHGALERLLSGVLVGCEVDRALIKAYDSSSYVATKLLLSSLLRTQAVEYGMNEELPLWGKVSLLKSKTIRSRLHSIKSIASKISASRERGNASEIFLLEMLLMAALEMFLGPFYQWCL
ncbi:hypothetical protein Tco_1010841 [Tanacetum coccineum]